MPHTPDYYNTVGERGAALKAYRSAAKDQNALVLDFFRSFPGGHTPSEVWRLGVPGSLLTSVRRSITTLTKRGLLRKTGKCRPGPYGRAELCWEYVDHAAKEMM